LFYFAFGASEILLALFAAVMYRAPSITFSGWVRQPIGIIIPREAGMSQNLPDLCLDAIPMQESPPLVADASS